MSYKKPIIQMIEATPNPATINKSVNVTVTVIEAESVVECYSGEIFTGEVK